MIKTTKERGEVKNPRALLKQVIQTKMKCKFCDYEWTTLSQMNQVCCPSCLNKNERKLKNEHT